MKWITLGVLGWANKCAGGHESLVFSDQNGQTAVVRAPGERFRLSALIQVKLFDGEVKIVSVCRLKDVHSGRGLPDRVGPVSPAVSG